MRSRISRVQAWKAVRQGARSFGGVVIDRDKIKFMAVAKQDPLIAWRNG